MADLYSTLAELGPPLIAGASGLFGAWIGSRGAIASQDRAQMLIAERENAERVRREQRTVEAFRGMVESIQGFAAVGARNKIASKDLEMHAITIAPFQRALQEPSLYLELAPAQIRAAFGMLMAIETMVIPLRDYETALEKLDQAEIAKARARLVDIYRDLLKFCNTAAVALDIAPIVV